VPELVPSLVRKSDLKIVLLVLDGLGGVRTLERGSELAEASTPNLDRLAAEGSSGVHTVVGPGITPGSGAGHMALFGYDPVQYHLGRGALSAAGVAFDLRLGDVAARVNFCTLDETGRVIDRTGACAS
jgi:2,3-bisphosphoglycerate-independent phosphoglycerate mutase